MSYKDVKKLLTCGVLLTAVALVWHVDGLRASLYHPESMAPSPLFELQLEKKILDMERTNPDAPEIEDDLWMPPSRESNPQQALIIFSEGASACISSACAISGCVGSACGASGCATSACGGSGCAGSGCIGSVCAGSGCGGSGCVGSGCGGSGCVSSGCGGSGCVGTGCAGTACQKCTKAQQSPTSDEEGEVRTASADGSCPLLPLGRSAGRFTSLDTVTTTEGTEVRWTVSGVEVDQYRVFHGPGESSPMLISKGPAKADRLMQVLVPNSEETTTLIVEVTDISGLPVRVQLEMAPNLSMGQRS